MREWSSGVLPIWNTGLVGGVFYINWFAKYRKARLRSCLRSMTNHSNPSNQKFASRPKTIKSGTSFSLNYCWFSMGAVSLTTILSRSQSLQTSHGSSCIPWASPAAPKPKIKKNLPSGKQLNSCVGNIKNKSITLVTSTIWLHSTLTAKLSNMNSFVNMPMTAPSLLSTTSTCW